MWRPPAKIVVLVLHVQTFGLFLIFSRDLFVYRHVLSTAMLPSSCYRVCCVTYIFQRDNRARESIQLLQRETCDLIALPGRRPSRSADLNSVHCEISKQRSITRQRDWRQSVA